jgi:hypothetical protein
MRYGEVVVYVRTVVAVALSVSCALGGTSSAWAQSSSERVVARNLGYSGIEAYQSGLYAVASERLEKAYAVLHVPSLGLWAARALAKQGRLLEAADRYAEVTQLEISSGDEAVQRKAIADAQTELEQTRQQLPGIIIRIRGASPNDAALRIDGRLVSTGLVGEVTPVNPGKHSVELKAGGKTSSQLVEVGLGEKKEVLLDASALTHSSAPAASSKVSGGSSGASASAPSASGHSLPADSSSNHGSWHKPVGFATLGVGAAGVAVGAITGALVLGKQHALDKNPGCADHSCPRSLEGDVSSYNSLRNVSTTAFIAGGVLAATGITLLLTGPKREAQAALSISPASIDLEYRFQ